MRFQYAHQYTEMDGRPYKRKVSEEEAAAHKPSGHRADGSPYWNYTTLRRPVGKWEEIDPARIREGWDPGDTPNPQ
jgi:hypothetical protein